VKVEALEGNCSKIQVYLKSIYTECDNCYGPGLTGGWHLALVVTARKLTT